MSRRETKQANKTYFEKSTSLPFTQHDEIDLSIKQETTEWKPYSTVCDEMTP
jgi:hypothetical protein